MLTTTKIETGTFTVQWNGKDTGYMIINGSLGLSGRDTRNVYGIQNGMKPPKWIGSIVSCKKLLDLTFRNAEQGRYKVTYTSSSDGSEIVRHGFVTLDEAGAFVTATKVSGRADLYDGILIELDYPWGAE